MATKIVIINYGMGNLHTVYRKLKRLNANAVVSSDINDIITADKLILPGVGHFKKAMQNLKQLDLVDALTHAVIANKKPILGICLGMQLFAKSSEEGYENGLGWIDGQVVRFRINDTHTYKIPHMGWNNVSINKASKLMKDITHESAFYFVHSYHFTLNNPELALNETEYSYRFISAVENGNVFGVQYHPEKSHDAGEILLKNFIDL